MKDKFQYLLIEKAETLIDYLAGYNKDAVTVIDTESISLDWSATLLGISIYQKSKTAAYIAVQTPYFQGRGIPLGKLVKIMSDFFEKHRMIVMHNAKYDLGVFDANGFSLPNVIRDTMLSIHLADADLEKNLEKRVLLDFGYQKKKFKELVNLAWNKITWNSETWKLFGLNILAEYAAEDAYWTYKLDEKYNPLLDEVKVRKIHDQIELPLCHVLKDMKKVGVRIDIDHLKRIAEPCFNEMNRLENEVHKLAGAIFNLNSPKQLAEILYDKMGYRCRYTTAKGARKSDKNALLDIQINQGGKIAELLIRRSQLNKLYTGYIDAIPKMVSADGRLRCDFNSEGAATGRFSSSNPNLQNQPNNKEFPVRAAFIPKEGYKFVILDWSQIELRIAAHLSGDEKMCGAFLSGRDIHQEVANQVGCSRSDAKGVNFGILYGLGAENLGFNIGKSKVYAEKMLAEYKSTYNQLQSWIEHVQSKAKIQGIVKTMFGRVRPIRGFKSSDRYIFSSAKRQAVNTVIQGTAADLMKIGLLRIDNYIRKQNLDAAILLSVHDEVLIEVKEELANEVYWHCKHLMETITPMRVPILAEGKICDNWAQGKDDSFIGYQRPLIKYDFILYNLILN